LRYIYHPFKNRLKVIPCSGMRPDILYIASFPYKTLD
jgi:hypothetical protein